MPLFLSAAYLIELTLVPITVRSCAACDMSHTSRLHCAICGRGYRQFMPFLSLRWVVECIKLVLHYAQLTGIV